MEVGICNRGNVLLLQYVALLGLPVKHFTSGYAVAWERFANEVSSDNNSPAAARITPSTLNAGNGNSNGNASQVSANSNSTGIELAVAENTATLRSL